MIVDNWMECRYSSSKAYFMHAWLYEHCHLVSLWAPFTKLPDSFALYRYTFGTNEHKSEMRTIEARAPVLHGIEKGLLSCF